MTNEVEQEALFNLAADVPKGFPTRFKKGTAPKRSPAWRSRQAPAKW
ncbi:hypothetical protein [Mesorhizobium sp.]|nr:hypothetical protein [Mesorhizobium sp.]